MINNTKYHDKTTEDPYHIQGYAPKDTCSYTYAYAYAYVYVYAYAYAYTYTYTYTYI